MHPDHRGLALLLSLGSLPIACNKPEAGDTGDTTTQPVTTTGDESSTTADGTTSTSGDVPTTGSTSLDPDTSTGPHATTFLTTNTDPDTGDTTDTDGPPPPPENPVCQGYLEQLIACFPDSRRYAAYYAAYCDELLAYGLRVDGQPCFDAIEAYFACFNATPCRQMNDKNCAAEEEAAVAVCPNSLGSDEPPPDTDTDTDPGTGTGTASSSTG